MKLGDLFNVPHFSKEGYDATIEHLTPRLLEYANREIGWLQSLVRRHQRKIGFRPEVCELGVGSGRVASILAPESGLLVGVDLYKSQLTQAKENLTSFPNVMLVQSDIRNLGLEDNLFDLVYIPLNTIGVVQENPLIIIQEATRIAKYEGIVFFGGFNEKGIHLQIEQYGLCDYLPKRIDEESTTWETPDGDYQSLRFSKERVKRLCKRSGLEDASIVDITPYTFVCEAKREPVSFHYPL